MHENKKVLNELKGIHELAKYQQFEDERQMMADVKIQKEEHVEELNATDRAVLDYLVNNAKIHPGVAYRKMSTIATDLKRTERTIRRSVAKLEELHIITRVYVLRKKTGGNGANIFLINPVMSARLSARQEDEKPVMPKDEAQKNQSVVFSFTKNDDININLYKRNTEILKLAMEYRLPIKETKSIIEKLDETEYHLEAIRPAFVRVMKQYTMGTVGFLPSFMKKALDTENKKVSWKKTYETFKHYNWLDYHNRAMAGLEGGRR